MQLTGKAAKFFEAAQARAAAAPATIPVPVAAAGPNKWAGRTVDRETGRDYMALSWIVPDPDQPRKQFDPVELQHLAGSLKQGQLQPVLLEWREDLAKWMILDGERRFIASQAAGMDRVWCAFGAKSLPADERLEKQLVANCLREDLKGIERARAFKRLMDSKGYNQPQLAARLHMHQGTIARALQLLEPEPEQKEMRGAFQSEQKELSVAITPEASSTAVGDTSPRSTGDVTEPSRPPRPRRRGPKPGKVRTIRTQLCTMTLTFKQRPTDDEVRDQLREALAQFPEGRAAA